jgi:catechol 2,3-dioxygenase-like lactoylglutathione lyase family enzyme
MLKFIAALSLASSLAAGTASAQLAPPNAAGVTMGHWHLNSRDVEANKKIFVAMGGTAIKQGNFDIVKFPNVLVYLNLSPGAAPSVGGTAGTVINHVGFTVPNVQEAIVRWKAAGVPVEPGKNRTDQAYVTTQDGLRVEILENKDQAVPIENHHVHFFVPAAQIPEIQAWYVKVFGAKASMRGNNQSADIPGVNLTFSKTDLPTVPTVGHVLDHIGFDIKNLEAFCKQLEAAGIKLDRPYTKNAQGDALAFVHDQWGTKIEMNERAQPM